MSGRYDWDAIRHAYESGSDVHTLVSLHGLRPDTLRRKARDQGWQRRPTDTSPTTTPTATTTAGILTTATATAQTATATASTVSTVTTEKATAGQGPTATAGISTGQTATATTQTATVTAPTVSTMTTEKVTAGQGPTATAGSSTGQTATATTPTVSAVTTEKVTAGQDLMTTTTPPTATPGIPAETMRTRAVTREDILRRHKDEWARHAELVDAALDDSDIELAKLAKVLAETMRIRQDGERRAWGINDKTDTDLSGPLTISWRSPA